LSDTLNKIEARG